MEKLEQWLTARSLVLCLLLGLVMSYAICTNGVVSEDAMPFGDGSRYVMRGMTLYGYLHTGRWSHLREVLSLPAQCFVLPHYLVFFLLPRAWASVDSYGIIQALTTEITLALGAWSLCRVLDRVVWAPSLFLLCAGQNILLDQVYFFFADAPFLALGMIAMALQIRAWRSLTWRCSALSGAGAAALFWIKPTNALVFFGTYSIAELARVALLQIRPELHATPRSKADLGPLRHAFAVASGFVPVLALALILGNCTSIFITFGLNEATGFFKTTLECTGLLRLFYFPLCLTYFYHAIALAVIFTGVGFAAFRMNRRPLSEPSIPWMQSRPLTLLLAPILIAYVVFGEVFSFGMSYKSMRFVLIIVPALWLGIFWILERWRVRPGLVFLGAAAYTLCALAQILFNSFESPEVSAESYQLKDDWLARFPSWHAGASSGIVLTRSLLTLIQQALPEGGKIAVGTEQLFLTSESLHWESQHRLALQGERSPYEFDNFLTSDGEFCRKSLLGARGVLVFTEPSMQYSQAVQMASIQLVQFSSDAWVKQNLVRVAALQGLGGKPFGYLVIARTPLDDEQVTLLIAGSHVPELDRNITFGETTERPFRGTRYGSCSANGKAVVGDWRSLQP